MQIIIDATSDLEKTLKDIVGSNPLEVKNYSEIKPEEAVLCLQREYALLRTSQTPEAEEKVGAKTGNSIRYLGTVNLMCCIFVYIYSPEDHFIIHVDDTRSLNFSQIINKFKNKNGLSAMVIGGMDYDNAPEKLASTSRKNFRYIVEQLIQVAATLKTKISVSQRVAHHNKLRESDKIAFVYNFLIENAQFLFAYIYGKPFDVSKITKSPDDLLKETLHLEDDAVSMLGLILVSNPLMNNPKAKELLVKLSSLSKNPEKFYVLLNSLMCKQVFTEVDAIFEKKQFYFTNQLRQFVIDIQTKAVIPIPGHTPIPHESIRSVRFMLEETSYYCCYNESTFIRPRLSRNILQKLSDLNLKWPITTLSDSQVPQLIRHHQEHKELIIGTVIRYLQDHWRDLYFNSHVEVKVGENSYHLFHVPKASESYAKELAKMINDNKLLKVESSKKELTVRCAVKWLEQLSNDSLGELLFGAEDVHLGQRKGLGQTL